MTALLTLLVLLATDQPAKPDAAGGNPPPRPPVHRTLFTVHNGEASALAPVLARHFKGEAEVSALPPGAGNALVISGPKSVTEDAVRLLEQLDRTPRSLAVEVVLAEVVARPAEGGREAVELPEAESGKDVLAKLEALAKAGQAASFQRVRLTAAEGSPASATVGGTRPVTVATVAGNRGGPQGGFGPGVQRSISMHQVGTTVRLTARVGSGNAVAIELAVEGSGVRPPESADDAPSIDAGTLAAKVVAPLGRPVVAQSFRAEGKAGRSAAYVIVTATVAEPFPASSR